MRRVRTSVTSQRIMPDRSLLSTKTIPPRDRLIFALDVPTKADALAWIDRLGDAVTFYKLGLEFCMSGQYFEVIGIKPFLGRLLQRSDDDHPGASDAVVLSWPIWKSDFGADPNERFPQSVPTEVADAVRAVRDLEKLTRWFKAAVKVTSIEEFRRVLSNGDA